MGFRWSAKARARHLGLTGYVRNLPNGTVEVVAEGTPEALEAMQTFCMRGPAGAAVTATDVEEGTATGEYGTFEVH